MVELVRTLRVPGKLKTKPLRAEARRDLDESEDEDGPRDRLCAALVDAANQLLESTPDARRFRRVLDPIRGDDDPLWVLLLPEVYSGLVRERLLREWHGREPTPAPAPPPRGPDRGEIDFDNFPSGDDPF